MPLFQDELFSCSRIVEQTLHHGMVVKLKLEPLPGERVKVLEYYQRVCGGKWERLREAEGRILPYYQLKLSRSFTEVFPVVLKQ